MFKFAYGNIDFAHKVDEPKKPSEAYEKHLHYFYEIVFFVKGDVTYIVGEESRQLYNGDLVFIKPGRNHFAEVNSEAKYERYVLKFDNSFIPPFLQEKLKNTDTFYTNASKYTSILKSLDSYIGNYCDEEIYTLMTSELLKLLVFLVNDKSETESVYNEQIAKIIYWIDEHIKEPITLERLSDTFNYSTSHICNDFKKYMKISIMKYVKTKKLIAAHNDILSGLKKNEVAEMYSFENYSTFYRLYIKTFHTSPGGKIRKGNKQA